MPDLIKKIMQKKAVIAVMGLGYVGLPTALAFTGAGFRVIGIDSDPGKAKKLRSKMHKTSSDPKVLRQADVILICVPTPLNKNKAPDLSCVIDASKDIAVNMREGQLVVLESTTYPGTTEEIVLPILEKSGLKANRDFHLAFSPERIDPGNKKFNLSNTPKVVGGLNAAATKLSEALYASISTNIVTVSSPRVAEMEKLFENIFRSVNIALANEMAILCRRMKIDVWEVIAAASTKPYGFMAFYPGPGLGGHCIPLDPFYLSWKAKEHDLHTRFIELAGEINTAMPYHVVNVIGDALNEKGKSLSGSKIFILGVAYKKDIDDMRESPAVKIIETLKEKGAQVYYNDPFIPGIKIKGKTYKSVKLTKSMLRRSDCSVIVTNHSAYDYQDIVEGSKVVVDTRNATKHVTRGRDRIVRL